MLKKHAQNWANICLVVVFIAFFAPPSRAEPQQRYKKHEIARARFGTEEYRDLLNKARHLKESLDKTVFGQDVAIQSLQDGLIQYFENFGTRNREPIALHFAGLPGVGKSALARALKDLGFPVERLDMQEFGVESGPKGENWFATAALDILNENKGKPLILFVDELDKTPEVLPDGREITQPAIGVLNQILTDGELTGYVGGDTNFSNVMIITAMNISPGEVEHFSEEVLGKKKSYYDFTIDELTKFNEWLVSKPGARSKILSRFFRPNTVSRISPNLITMRPLSLPSYEQIIRSQIDQAILTATADINAPKKLQVSYGEGLVQFLLKNTVNPPTGARETIIRTDKLVQQLIGFGQKATIPGDHSLDRPRKIQLNYDETKARAEITITPQQLDRSGSTLRDLEPFRIEVEYSPESRLFAWPNEVALDPPSSIDHVISSPEKKHELTKKEIRSARFPENSKKAAGLAKYLDSHIFGQESITAMIEKEMNIYLGRNEPAVRAPMGAILAGFPGNGKSEIWVRTAEKLDIPLIKVNMQQFSSDSTDVAFQLVELISQQMEKANKKADIQKRPEKYIVLFEEIDKVNELNPQTGALVDRPVMAVVKDILNEGKASSIGSASAASKLDLSGAYLAGTMNFGVDRFGFEADPRLTSIDDVIDAWKEFSTHPADLKELLASMFLPDTVSRIMNRLHMTKPLDKDAYRKVIDQAKTLVTEARLIDAKSKVNKTQIQVEMTDRYKEYLFRETVIPSEGARNTTNVAQNKIGSDLEEAMKKLPKSKEISTAPMTIILDFDPKKAEVVVSARAQMGNRKTKREEIFRKAALLFFPPDEIRGKIPLKRLKTAAHEFGHAYVAIRLGLRIHYATPVPPKQEIGGYVTFKRPPQTASAIVANIYSTLASRALERMFLSDNPSDPRSVLKITSGPSSDILQATSSLWDALFELGLDPNGGTIERKGATSEGKYATFSDLPADQVAKIGKVLREMEDFIVQDLLKANDFDWYVKKVQEFAAVGGIDEKRFYELLKYPYPGNNTEFLGETSKIRKIFGKKVEDLPKAVLKAKKYKQSATKTTAEENMSRYMKFFEESLVRNLHPEIKLDSLRVGCEKLLL